ncbi:MAG: gluconokinase [Flavobacteriaceae bacterium]
MSSKRATVYFVMGVSGCGKSTVGSLLARELSVPFFDGDDYHPPSNIHKMSSGLPLNDQDRKGWLKSLNALASENVEKGAVIVCSALKADYREILSKAIKDKVDWVLLDGSFEEISARLNKRKGHFMPASLLRSQFETLEKPQKGIIVSITATPADIVKKIMNIIEAK